MVGAMIVSGIETPFHGLYRAPEGEIVTDMQPAKDDGTPLKFNKGEEFGRFLLGSTVILLSPPGFLA